MQKNKSIIIEEIESAASILVNILYEKLKEPFYNWFANLEGLQNQSEFIKQAICLGDTPFISMGIMKNDKCHAHKDDDVLLGFIIFFT